MRKNSAQTAQIVDFIYAKVDNANDNVALVGAGSSHNITNGEVQLLDPHSSTGDFLQISDANNYEEIQIVQGTPNSTALYNVDPFGTGYPDVERSGILKKGKVLSAAKYAYADPTYQVTQIKSVSGFDANTTYQLVATMQSVRGDIVYGMNKEVFSVSYDKSLATPTQATILKHFATELNKFSSIVGNVTNIGGTKPFVVLALAPTESGDTLTSAGVLGGLDIGDSVTVGTFNGQAVSLNIDANLYHTLTKAVIADATLFPTDYADGDTDAFKVVDCTTSTTIARLLIIALDETPLLAFDDVMEVKTRIDFGINDLTYTKTELVKPFEGTGLGRQVLLWYRQKAKLQKFNMQNHPVHGEFFINQDLPEYFTTTGKYSLTVIDYYDTVDTINGTSVHPKQVVIVHDAASAKGASGDTLIDAIPDGGLVVTTTATVNFDDQLSAWITGSNSVKPIKLLGAATLASVSFSES